MSQQVIMLSEKSISSPAPVSIFGRNERNDYTNVMFENEKRAWC